MHILISGSSGLVGSALKQRVTEQGHTVAALPRSYEEPIDFNGVDAVVHLAGENIAAGRWTARKKRRIEESRVAGTKQLSDQIAASPNPPSVFICASAIGYYGDRGDDRISESSGAGDGFLSEVCRKWEDASRSAEEAGVRTVRIRTGIVLSPEGGALKKMLPAFRMGVGGVLGNGSQFMSWISLEDEVEIIIYLMHHPEIAGAVNLVAPRPVTNREFTRILGRVLKRPSFFPVPAFAAKLLFGEMADALLLSSTKVYPDILEAAGYMFKHPLLEEALRDLLT